MEDQKPICDRSIVLKEFRKATLIVSEDVVCLNCLSENGSINLEFGVDLLPRLLALCLHVAGRIPQSEDEQLVALKPEGWAVHELSGKTIGVAFNLPGGSLLTFCMQPGDVEALAQATLQTVADLGQTN